MATMRDALKRHDRLIEQAYRTNTQFKTNLDILERTNFQLRFQSQISQRLNELQNIPVSDVSERLNILQDNLNSMITKNITDKLQEFQTNFALNLKKSVFQVQSKVNASCELLKLNMNNLANTLEEISSMDINSTEDIPVHTTDKLVNSLTDISDCIEEEFIDEPDDNLSKKDFFDIFAEIKNEITSIPKSKTNCIQKTNSKPDVFKIINLIIGILMLINQIYTNKMELKYKQLELEKQPIEIKVYQNSSSNCIKTNTDVVTKKK